MWQNKRAYHIITNNPCPHINAELLLVSRMGHTTRILLYPLVLVWNIDVLATEKRASSVKTTDETKKFSELR
jgi:hypothetical protein